MRGGEPRAIVICLVLACATAGCRAPAAAPAPAAPTLPTTASVGGANIVAISPPGQQCCPKQTLPQFLGINGLFRGIGGLIDRLRNRLGSIWPGMEAKPEILSITDPANLESDNPAIATAAEAKAQEDEAAQKAKAISYLGKLGCAGCYPGIEEAILAALDDCTEEVRFEAAKTLRTTANMPCKNCCRSACCGPKVREKLIKLAYETDSQGCYLESSDRVRRMARLALANCNCVPEKPGQTPDRLPAEGPTGAEGPAAATAALPLGGPTTASVLRPPSSRTATPAPIVEPAKDPAIRRASLEQTIAAYSDNRTTTTGLSQEITYEIWSARHADFRTAADANALMAIARTQVMSSQPVNVPLQLAHQVRGFGTATSSSSPVLAAAIAATPVGGVSGIVEDQSGWHIIRVLGKRPKSLAGPIPAAAAVMPATAIVPAAHQAAASVSPVSAPSRIVAVRMKDCDCR